MANVLTKLCFGRAIGVYYSTEQVSITDVGLTIKGPTTLNQQTFEVKDGNLKDVLQEYIKNHGGKNAPVCLGLKPEQTFFITSRTELQQEPGQVRDKLLEQAGFHSGEERSRVVVDYMRISKTKSSSSPLCSIGVCRKQIAGELHNTMAEAGFTDFILKPTPWSMAVHSLPKLPKGCKGWKVYVIVFLNETGGVAVLMLEKHPICWKRFTTTAESVDNMISAIRSIFLQSIVTLSRAMVDGIVLQGAEAKALSEKLYNSLGIEVVVMDGPGFSDLYCSESLAASAKAKEVNEFDLFGELRTKPGILKIFPWKIATAIIIAAICMGFMMWQKAKEIKAVYVAIKKQNAAYSWAAGKSTQAIAKEKKNLLAETEAVVKYVSTRMIWSDYLNDLPSRLPPNLSLMNFGGFCPYQEGGKKESTISKKDVKTLTLRGFTKNDNGQNATKEIEAFLESLRKVDMLKKDFPRVELAEVRWRKEGRTDKTIFTIQAKPKKVEAGQSGAKDAKDTKTEKGGEKGAEG